MQQQQFKQARQLGALLLVLSLTAAMSASAGLKGSLKKASKSAESAIKQTTQTATPRWEAGAHHHRQIQLPGICNNIRQ